jgi:hypothetical protein
MKRAPHPDKQIITAHGGVLELARKLGYDPARGGIQRVQNWTVRGIPARVRLEHADVFGPTPSKKEAA